MTHGVNVILRGSSFHKPVLGMILATCRFAQYAHVLFQHYLMFKVETTKNNLIRIKLAFRGSGQLGRA